MLVEVIIPDTIEKLRGLTKLNFCEDCYRKYRELIEGEIESLLFKPLPDWLEVEINIDLMWIKAKGYFKNVNTKMFSPNKNAFNKARNTKNYNKLKDLRDEGILQPHTYAFLNRVRKIRNKIHPQYIFSEGKLVGNGFSKQDYTLFRQAKELTRAMLLPILHDLQDDEIWGRNLVGVENRAKKILINLAD